MIDNVRPLKAGIPIEANKDKELVAHLSDHLSTARAEGLSTLGMVSITFFMGADGNLHIKQMWDIGNVPAPSQMVLACAVVELQKELLT
jgi:hypothetical protein